MTTGYLKDQSAIKTNSLWSHH